MIPRYPLGGPTFITFASLAALGIILRFYGFFFLKALFTGLGFAGAVVLVLIVLHIAMQSH